MAINHTPLDSGVGVGERLSDDFEEHLTRFDTLCQFLGALRNKNPDTCDGRGTGARGGRQKEEDRKECADGF